MQNQKKLVSRIKSPSHHIAFDTCVRQEPDGQKIWLVLLAVLEFLCNQQQAWGQTKQQEYRKHVRLILHRVS